MTETIIKPQQKDHSSIPGISNCGFGINGIVLKGIFPHSHEKFSLIVNPTIKLDDEVKGDKIR